MTTELMEGLRLAGVGMGLVFATLVALMVILFALGKLFPGEEVEQEAEDASATTEAAATTTAAAPSTTVAAAPAAPVDLSPRTDAPPAPAAVPAPQPPVAPAQSRDGVTGERIAALAVSVYLAMEQEEAERAAAAAASAAVPQPAQHSSSWGSLGRAALWRSQGRRPPAYGHRPHSAYNPTRGGRS